MSFVFVSHHSAIEALRFLGSRFPTWPDAPRLLPLMGDCIYRQRDVAKLDDSIDFASFGLLTRPIDLLVPDRTYRRRGRNATTHLWSSLVPAGAFLRVHHRLLVSAPEFALLQLAQSHRRRDADVIPLDEPEQASLSGKAITSVRVTSAAMELMGTYRLSDADEQGTRYQVTPLCSPLSLQGFIEQACTPIPLSSPGQYGTPMVPFGYRHTTAIEIARNALEWAVEGSASPVETALTLMLTLPDLAGGFGLPKPLLNHALVVDGVSVVPDLIWPEAKVVVEYDSDEFHAALGRDKTDRDIMRANLLRAKGFNVFEVTPGIAFDEARMARFAGQLADALGVRAAGSSVKQRSLHRELFTARG